MTLQRRRGFRGGRLWPNRHITFIVAEKVLFTVTLAHLRYIRGIAENVIWR